MWRTVRIFLVCASLWESLYPASHQSLFGVCFTNLHGRDKDHPNTWPTCLPKNGAHVHSLAQIDQDIVKHCAKKWPGNTVELVREVDAVCDSDARHHSLN